MGNLKKFWIILVVGLILRLIIAPFTFHPDIKTPALSSAVVFNTGTLQFYDQAKNLAPGEVLDDLPLSYLISLPFHTIGRFLASGNIELIFLSDHHQLFGNPQLWLYLFYIKLPLIFFDILLAILLFYLVEEKFKKWALIIWLFNPISIWTTTAIGQLDIYPTFFMVLSAFFIKKDRLDLGALSLGLGGAIKSSPLLLLPFILGISKSWSERFKLIILAVIPYLVTVIPYLQSTQFRTDALFAPQINKILYSTISLSGNESIYITLGITIFLYFFFYTKNRGFDDYINFSLVGLLLVLAFTHFHMQWFLWIIPLLIIWWEKNYHNNSFKLPILGLFVSFLIMLFSFESSLQVQLFSPLFPDLMYAKGLTETLSGSTMFFIRSLGATLFASSVAFLSLMILRK